METGLYTNNNWQAQNNFTCTIVAMSIGSIDMGNLRMLNSESETNAFSASRMLYGDDRT